MYERIYERAMERFLEATNLRQESKFSIRGSNVMGFEWEEKLPVAKKTLKKVVICKEGVATGIHLSSSYRALFAMLSGGVSPEQSKKFFKTLEEKIDTGLKNGKIMDITIGDAIGSRKKFVRVEKNLVIEGNQREFYIMGQSYIWSGNLDKMEITNSRLVGSKVQKENLIFQKLMETYEKMKQHRLADFRNAGSGQ